MRLPDRSDVARVASAWWLPAALACTVGTLYICFSLAQWRTLSDPSWDLAIFAEAVQAYSRFEAPIVPIKAPGYNSAGRSLPSDPGTAWVDLSFLPVSDHPPGHPGPVDCGVGPADCASGAAALRARWCRARWPDVRVGVGSTGRGQCPVSRGLCCRPAVGRRRRCFRRAAVGCLHGVVGTGHPCQGGPGTDCLRRRLGARVA